MRIVRRNTAVYLSKKHILNILVFKSMAAMKEVVNDNKEMEFHLCNWVFKEYFSNGLPNMPWII